MTKPTILRITTVPISLDKLLEGQLRFMNEWFKVVAVASDPEYLKQIGVREGVEVFALEMTRQITPIRDLIAVVKLFLFLRKNETLIVHSHTPKAGIVGMLAALIAGVPHRLHTVAGLPLLEATGNKRRLLDLVEKITYACATGVYPNSKSLKEIILGLKFCKPEKLKVIGNGSSNGINTAYFDPALYTYDDRITLKTTLGIGVRDFVFIYVGRLVGDKGINELISAFNQVLVLNDSVKLLLVGPLEPELDPLESQTMEWIKTDPNIISVGYQKDVRPYFSIADALVFPSYREGFPNVVMQAGAMGMPAIVTDINGCNEIIEDGKNGLIIPVKDRDQLAKAMLRLLEDQQLNLKLQDNARVMITSRFEQMVIWQALLAEYKSINGWK